ncbi:MAG: hypothetical protein ACOYJW_04520 [Candidatus Omnitrophota bacterium]|jgi:opacity protein-like surface antigen
MIKKKEKFLFCCLMVLFAAEVSLWIPMTFAEEKSAEDKKPLVNPTQQQQRVPPSDLTSTMEKGEQKTTDVGKSEPTQKEETLSSPDDALGEKPDETAEEKAEPEEEKPEAPIEEAIKEPEKKEKEAEFFVLEDLWWDNFEDNAKLNIAGEKQLPPAQVLLKNDGRVVTWRPAQTAVMKQRKKMVFEEGLMRGITLREDSEATKLLGLAAPYYVLAEIEITFSSKISFNEIRKQDEDIVSLEFFADEESPGSEDAERPEEKDLLAAPAIDVSSVEDMLGKFYEASQMYQTFLTGRVDPSVSGAGAWLTWSELAKLRSEKKAAIDRRQVKPFFDGRLGMPADISPVFKESYPKFGTPEYWKKHVRATINQRMGYTTEFDGQYGFSSEKSSKDGALVWHPDVTIAYHRPGVLDLSGAYRTNRIFPMGNRYLYFGDGLRHQNASWGVGYFPQKRYAVGYQGSINYYTSKELIQDSVARFRRKPHDAKTARHVVGLNYQLTRRLMAGMSLGMVRTRSRNEGKPGDKSRDREGYLAGSLNYALTRRSSVSLDYSLRHIFEDKDDSLLRNTPQSKVITKTTNFHSFNFGMDHQLTKKISLRGSSRLGIIGKDIHKFGGNLGVTYQFTRNDRLSFYYSNSVLQDNMMKVLGWRPGIAGGVAETHSIQIYRVQNITAGYSRQFRIGSIQNAPYTWQINGTYFEREPLSGVHGGWDSTDDGISFETSIRRPVTETMSLQIGYRFTNFHSKGADPDSTLDTSTKKHFVFLAITNQFGGS